MYVRPTIDPPILHVSGSTVGVSAVAIRAAIIPVTIVGRIRRETNFNATLPGDRRILGRLAIGSAMAAAILCFCSLES